MKNEKTKPNIEGLKKGIELATLVLEGDKSSKKKTYFEEIRELILSFFSDVNDASKATIMKRLIIIDSFYSTNMSKRLYGIDDLAEAISKLPQGEKLNAMLNTFLADDEKKISNIFQKNYGINKKGDDFGQAISLVSKYFYFFTKYNFPIYDSLVRNNVNQVLKAFDIKSIKVNGVELFRGIYKVCKVDYPQIEFAHFDHLVWLYGKVRYGKIASIITKEQYLKLITHCEKELDESFDEQIAKFLANKNKIKELHEEKILDTFLYEFLDWRYTYFLK